MERRAHVLVLVDLANEFAAERLSDADHGLGGRLKELAAQRSRPSASSYARGCYHAHVHGKNSKKKGWVAPFAPTWQVGPRSHLFATMITGK